MEKKQTAVDWLEQAYWDNKGTLSQKHFEQAKQMEKEQIVDAIFFGMQKGLNVNKVPETDNDWVNNYYNETYGGQDE
jgi:hypothetical protein